MRRGVLIFMLVFAGLLLCAPIASGEREVRNYQGAIALEPESVLTFDVIKKKSGKKKVANLQFDGVPAGCFDDTRTEVSGGIQGTAKAKKKRKFKLEKSDPLETISFTGRVRSRGKRAEGEFRFNGVVEVNGQSERCDTGPRTWEARRV